MMHVLGMLAAVLCVVADPGQGVGPTLAPQWPERAFEAELGAKGVVLELPGDPRWYRSDRVGFAGGAAGAAEHVRRYLEVLGEKAPGEAGVDVDPAGVGAEGLNALVFINPLADREAGGMPAPADGVRTLLFVSLRGRAPYELERTWMAYEPATTGNVEGLAVIIPGTFGYPAELYEKWSMDLRQRGWSVLRLLSQPSRFTERVDFAIGAGEGAQVAAEFAVNADMRAAESAFAVEAACDWIAEREGWTEGVPRAVLGFSGGAILAPAVVAREPAAYSSVVLVAGGANAASISMDSTFMARFIRSAVFDFSGDDPARDRLDFEAAYLRRGSLDPFHAVMAFEDDARVLVLDGSFDRAVPFGSSELLVERLVEGGVDLERRTYPSNHVMLFMSLVDMIEPINAWIEGGELTLPAGQEAQEPAKGR